MAVSISCLCEVSGTMKQEPLVARHWQTDLPPIETFGALFERFAPNDIKDLPIKVEIGHKLPHREPGQWVNVQLDQQISLVDQQPHTHRYVVKI